MVHCQSCKRTTAIATLEVPWFHAIPLLIILILPTGSGLAAVATSWAQKPVACGSACCRSCTSDHMRNSRPSPAQACRRTPAPTRTSTTWNAVYCSKGMHSSSTLHSPSFPLRFQHACTDFQGRLIAASRVARLTSIAAVRQIMPKLSIGKSEITRAQLQAPACVNY